MISYPVKVVQSYWKHEKYGVRPFERHSLVLTLGGFVYIMYGLVMQTWTIDGPRASAISVGLKFFPLQVWGAAWVLVGFLAILSARWPLHYDKWGYTVLTGLSSAWAAVYFAGLFFENNTISETTGGLVWVLVALLWWGIAGLFNPDRVIVIELETSDGLDE